MGHLDTECKRWLPIGRCPGIFRRQGYSERITHLEIAGSRTEFETCPDWVPRLDKGAGTLAKLLFPKRLK
jgi:hypothetical protein